MGAIVLPDRVFQDVGSVENMEIFVAPESTTNFSGYITCTAAHAVPHIGGFAMSFDPGRQNRQDSVGSASVRGTYDRVGKGTFSFPVYVVPSGAKTTVPEDDLLLKSLMGTQATTTIVTWTFNATTPTHFNIHAYRTTKQQTARGAFVRGAAITFGTDLVTCTYNGFYRQETKTGKATVQAYVQTTSNFIAYDGGTTSVFAGQVFDVDSRIKFLTSKGGGGGQSTVAFVVDGITPTTGVVSMTASTTVTISVGVVVQFIQPTATFTTDQPVSEVSTRCHIDLGDGNGYQEWFFTTATLNINNGWDLRTSTAGGIYGTGIIRTQRQRAVSGSITLHDREPYTQLIGRAKDSSRAAEYNNVKIKFLVGTAGSGSQIVYEMPACQLMRPTNPGKNQGEEDLVINFVATWSAADNDELKIYTA